jgi:subtilisin-like proprotein convertase family protein
VFSLDLTQVAVEGFFTFDIRITSGTVEFIRPISLFLRRNDFSGLALQTPANGLTSAALTQTLRWSKGLDADAYDVEFSASPTFNTILASRTNTAIDSFKINFLLQKGSAYYWRVRPVNECGRGEWLPTFFFSTYAEDCKVFVANDLPKNISANGTPTVESKITVNQGGTISDVNLKQISGTHTFYKDLETHLIGPSGTDVLLWKDKCANFNGPFNFGLDDSAPGAFPCPPNNTGNYYRPVNPLTPFIGQNSTGTWTLRVKDNVSSSGGTLGAFSMEFCATLSITPPVLVVNNVMPLPSGTSRVISPDYLLVEDPNNTHAELKYTLISVPEHGTIERLNVGVLNVGDQFTQANLDAGEILFNDNGTSAAPDGFYFMVTDGEFGFFGAPKFVAQPLVGTKEAQQTIEFMLFPNPASERVQLAFGQTLESDAQVEMFNMAGSKIGFWDMPQGSSSLALAVKDLPKGLYLVSVQTSNGKGVKKLVVK